MKELLQYWVKLEERTLNSIQVLQVAALPLLPQGEDNRGMYLKPDISKYAHLKGRYCALLSGLDGSISKKKISKIKKKAGKVDSESYITLIDYLTTVSLAHIYLLFF